jgi:hypothetical protein
MAESTCVEGGVSATSSREHQRAVEAARRDRVRRTSVHGLRNMVVGGVIDLIYHDSPQRFGARGVALAHITFQTALALSGMWEERRAMRPGEAATFQMLGGLAARAGATVDDMQTALDAAWELVLGKVRGAIKGGPWARRTGVTVARQVEREAQAFASQVSDMLVRGFEAEDEFTADQAGVVLRILDGALAGDELGAAASAAGLDASRPHGIALLVSTSGSSADVEAVASEAVDRIPYLLDLGMGDNLPLHRRLVVPLVSPGQWLVARGALHEIAVRHHVLVLAPAAAPNLAGLRPSYEQTEHGAGWMLAACGTAYGIIDPACLMPQADGPAPSRQTALILAPEPVAVGAA